MSLIDSYGGVGLQRIFTVEAHHYSLTSPKETLSKFRVYYTRTVLYFLVTLRLDSAEAVFSVVKGC